MHTKIFFLYKELNVFTDLSRMFFRDSISSSERFFNKFFVISRPSLSISSTNFLPLGVNSIKICLRSFISGDTSIYKFLFDKLVNYSCRGAYSNTKYFSDLFHFFGVSGPMAYIAFASVNVNFSYISMG